MKLNAPTAGKSIIALQRIALGFPGTEEGTSCGKRAFKARKKAFLFVGSEESSYNIMLKLHESLPEATRLQAKSPQNYAVGGHGWVKATFKNPEALPSPLFDRWIKESYRLLAPKGLVAALQSQGVAGTGVSRPAKKKAAKLAS